MLGQQRGLLAGVGERDIDDVDLQQLGLAGIKAAFVDVESLDAGAGNAQGVGYQRRQGGFRVVQRKFEFSQANHGAGLVLIKQPVF